METKHVYRYKPRKIPDNADPVLQWMLREMNLQQCSYKELSARSGVSVQTIKGWSRHGLGTWANLKACVNALGYALRPERQKDYDT